MVHKSGWAFEEVTEKLQQLRGYQLPSEMVDLLLEINLENMESALVVVGSTIS